MAEFLRAFEVTADTRVLDVGGNAGTWMNLPVRPRVTLVNLSPVAIGKHTGPAMQYVVGDGCKLPFRDQSFDIVFSNSVIEHLGNAYFQEAFAKEVARVGRRFYVQTPNRWFPIEPHLLTPFIHFSPKSWQRTLVRHFTVWGLVTKPSRERCIEMVSELRLLTRSEVQQLFPHGVLRREKFAGLTKSFTITR